MGLEVAKESLNLKDKNKFYNALNLIKNDKTFDTFKIEALPSLGKGKLASRIMLDDKIVYTGSSPIPATNDAFKGLECISDILFFITDYYSPKLVSAVENTETTLTKIKNAILDQLADVNALAHNELDNKILNIVG